MSRDKQKVFYTWDRERRTYNRWKTYLNDYVNVHFSTETKNVLNVDGYRPGDFLQFFKDHRTRADYLQWAPLLLAAEDFHGKEKDE